MNRAARLAGRSLAMLLIAGGLLAALGGNGFARVLRGVEGYASFLGYVPEKCMTSTEYARAINGDVIRVCQHEANITYGFFSGHDALTLGDSDTSLHVALPDAGKHFSWYDPYGDSEWFEPATLDPVVPGNPATGAAHFSAVSGDTKYLDVVQTAKVAAGASAYTLTWSITNRTTVDQRVRPLVATTGFGYWGKPSFGHTVTPLSVTVRNPMLGGAITLSGATPPASSWTAGGTQHRVDASIATAPPLDSIEHDDGYPSHESEIAMAWDVQTLAPDETADFTVTVTLARSREVQLKARTVPTANAPTIIDALVYDERGFAGKQLIWSAGGGGGTATIGADGKAVLTVPGRGGEQRIDVWADTDGDGGFKGDEPYTYGYIYAPGTAGPQPTATPGGSVLTIGTPPRAVPIPAPVAKPFANSPLHMPFNRSLKVKASKRAKACRGSVTAEIRNGKTVLQRKSVKLTRSCAVKTTFTVPHSVLGTVKSLTVVVTPPKRNRYLKTARFTVSVPPAPPVRR
ncbi:hypothetical protein [Solirubrobacter soli]|uniref:hypothetical protein n=1 Tax=Solirubrobacter soli TaxID=363832 RepID=UPI0005651BB1|nr:hypothetical protein [Solirubrobacter soli]